MGKFTEKQRMINKKVRSFPYFKFTAMLPMAEGCMLSCLIDRSDYQKDPMYLEVNYKTYLQKYLPGWSEHTIETQIKKLIKDEYVFYHKRISNGILIQINWEKVHELEADYELYLKQFEVNEEDSESVNTLSDSVNTLSENESTLSESVNTTLKNNMNNMNNMNNREEQNPTHGVSLEEKQKNIIYSGQIDDPDYATYKSVTAPRVWFRACRDKWGEELTVKKVKILDRYLNKYPDQRKWILGRDLNAFINGINEAYRVLNYNEEDRFVEV